MTPRWPLFLGVLLAGLPLLAPALAAYWIPLSGETVATLLFAGGVLNVGLLLLGLLDMLVSPRLSNVRVERSLSEVMSVGARNRITIFLTNTNRRELTVDFHDETPSPCATDGLPFSVTLVPLKQRYRVYHVTPQHRGQNHLGHIFLRARSLFGFWQMSDTRELYFPVRIYPDIQAVHGIELLARKNRLAEAGLKLSRLRGRGSEFDRLREYRREDELRHVDWKATARHNKLISREFVVERNQNILLVVDCGRSMCNVVDGVSHLDRALNAAIILSYVALRQGDNVGLLAVSNRVERWVRPVRGTGGVQSVIRQVYDLDPQYEATDYGLMVEELRRRYRKRSLVMLLTHAIDELHLAAISHHMRHMKSPHLVLGAFLRNVPLYNRMSTLPKNDLEAFQVASAAVILESQTRQIAEMSRNGLMALDVLPEDLSPQLVSMYLDIKARHLL